MGEKKLVFIVDLLTMLIFSSGEIQQLSIRSLEHPQIERRVRQEAGRSLEHPQVWFTRIRI